MDEAFPHPDGCFGEAWSGTAPDGSHINVVIGRRGSPTAAAAATALACPSAGHAPVMACLGAGNAVRPATIILNKATIASDLHGRITWGAAQLGIAQGVMDAVADGAIAAADTGDLVLLACVWVDPEAADETAVRLANRDAARRAIADAIAGDRRARLDELMAMRDAATNAFYAGR
ncbi:MAG TPA: formaldehyde-activating enzyme [Gaiellales bacterium]|jgi:5,6,7,8-tetrahydromethanopterin hydro-lyase|nr:formaldehyde-activating enzyme [Gaiellales bacterium]